MLSPWKVVLSESRSLRGWSAVRLIGGRLSSFSQVAGSQFRQSVALLVQVRGAIRMREGLLTCEMGKGWSTRLGKEHQCAGTSRDPWHFIPILHLTFHLYRLISQEQGARSRRRIGTLLNRPDVRLIGAEREQRLLPGKQLPCHSVHTICSAGLSSVSATVESRTVTCSIVFSRQALQLRLYGHLFATSADTRNPSFSPSATVDRALVLPEGAASRSILHR